MNQQIRFCTSSDGVRIAYAITGSGPLLVRAPQWISHLEHDWDNVVWQRSLAELSSGHALLRMDERACGLSDWNVPEISFEAWVRDLEAVVDAAGFDRFALLGQSQGGAIAIEYAARHPERVSHLVLHGAYARGRLKRELTPAQVEDAEVQLKLIELGWGQDEPAYRQVFASQFMPGGTLKHLRAWCELQRAAASPSNAVRIIRAFYTIDARESARQVRCPTLVLHSRGDQRVPFEEGRLLAALIPGARLVPLESPNHILLEEEPAWTQFFAELRAFLPRGQGAVSAAQPSSSLAQLTEREAQILECIAQGMGNAEIAARLDLSAKTVRNHITHIFDKLAVEHRGQAIVLAREAGFGQGRAPLLH